MDPLRQLALIAVLTGATCFGAENETPSTSSHPLKAPPPKQQDVASSPSPVRHNNPPTNPSATSPQPPPPAPTAPGPLRRIKTKPLAPDANIPLPQDI